jgi:protein disulfide isomerase
MKKFPVADEVGTDGAAIAAHLVKVLTGELKPVLKSEEPEPTDTEGPVTVIRGKTFESIVLDTTKDVLVEFYAPWCGHCKSLAPIYEELGEKYGSDKLVIAKIDSTANEIEYPGVNVRGFPTLFFFPATEDGADKVAQEFEGSRDLDGLSSFLKTHATSPIVEAEDAGKDEL